MKITKRQLKQIIKEEVDKVFSESEAAISRMKKRTQEVSVWKTFCSNTTDANYPRDEEGRLIHYDKIPDELEGCKPVARSIYLTIKKNQGKIS